MSHETTTGSEQRRRETAPSPNEQPTAPAGSGDDGTLESDVIAPKKKKAGHPGREPGEG